MKHGRRHDALKEKTYVDRYRQGAPGYGTPVPDIDRVPREPEPPREPVDAPEPAFPLELQDVLDRRSQRHLARGLRPKPSVHTDG